MFPVNQPIRRRPLRGSSELRSGEKQGAAPRRQRHLLIRQRRTRLRQVQLNQVRQPANKMCRLMQGPKRRSRIRSRCSRSNHSTRTFVRSQSRSRFRRLPITRIIGFKEPNTGRVQQYEVFRSYHPEWHDQGWYHSHYNRVELIGGGYYFWNAGYWYPAWGYSPSAQYYAYDGPIYVGQHAEPPDKVIADVQAVLQQMGYYTGEVDGLLGPLTREALTAYQADQGLTQTAAIDEPTLDSLGMS